MTTSISKDDWYEHFFNVFNLVNTNSEETINNNVVNIQPIQFVNNQGILNCIITHEEICISIKNLKKGKSAGPDGLVAEMFICLQHMIVPYLSELFNDIFHRGIYPDLWTKSVIVPIHKKGSTNLADNYRGISLGSVFSKIFTSSLNRRLTSFTNTNKIVTEEQAGFRRDYSTVDNGFVLKSVVHKYLNRNKKVYVAFIDFRKAFDTVNRLVLWNILRKMVTGNFLNIIKSIYENVVSSVKYANGNTEYFTCPNGLKQGCILSPMLFLLLVQENTNEIRNRGGYGIQLTPDMVELSILLFADDIVSIADTVFELQKKLDVLYEVATKLGLIVNIDKSKVLVFRKGGRLAGIKKWHVDGKKL